MKRMILRPTGRAMSIAKSICSICLVFCIVAIGLLPITAQAADRFLVTILLIPDKSFEYTDYDSAYLTIVNNHTGQSFSYTLYPYNNFSNKVWLDAGTYSVLDVGINGRTDIIFESTSEDIVVDRATAIVVNFGDSKIIAQNTTASTTKAETTAQTTTGTTNPEIPTLFPIVTGEFSTTQNDVSEQSTVYIVTTTLVQEPTTAKSDERFAKKHPVLMPVIVLVVFVTIVCIVFFAILYKKNKAEE